MLPEAASMAKSPYEGVMNGFLGRLLIAQDRDGDAKELAVAASVDALDLGVGGRVAPLPPYHLTRPERLTFPLAQGPIGLGVMPPCELATPNQPMSKTMRRRA
jgi:hypothetical protein